jgi:hypothetical protein
MRVFDLFSGLGGFSAAFRDRGHEVVTVDIEERFHPTIRADVRTLRGEPGLFDVVLASPPCQEFSMRFLRPNAPPPDLSCVEAVWRLRRELQAPTIVENVQGAQEFLGRAIAHRGSQYLWGDVPPVLATMERQVKVGKLPERAPGHGRGWVHRHREISPGWRQKAGWNRGPEGHALRALIPYPLSLALCMAMEASE